jgi:hypothetical protein
MRFTTICTRMPGIRDVQRFHPATTSAPGRETQP